MKSKVMKIAVFGGSFDPVTFAHADIVKNLEKYFDKAIVVPSFVSPFKTGAENGKTRLKLCKKVFTSQKTEVCNYEIRRGGVSYSVDTAAYLSKREKDAALFWVIGSEELVRLDGWRDMDKLKKLVTFYVVPRPGYEVKQERLAALKKLGIKVKLAPFTGIDCSSTVVKLDAAFGKPNKYVPSVVYDYAQKNGLFDPYGKYAQKLFEYGLDTRRIEHTYRTAVRGAELAKMYGGSVSDTVVACILHDIAKSVDIRDYADKIDLSYYPAPTVHAAVGAYIARREFPELSDDIIKAIEQHSTADKDMSLLAEIVYLADKTETGRTYRSLERMTYLCSLDKNIAMLAALLEIGGLESSDKCEMSERAIAYYKQLVGDKPIPELPKRTFAWTLKPRVKKQRPPRDDAQKMRHAYAKLRPPVTRYSETDPSNVSAVAHAVAEELSNHKAYNIDIISLEGKTIIADYFVIASATSTTAVKALTDYVEDRLKKQFNIDPSKRDTDREWVALDYGDVIVHIFTDRTREFYNIERLWADSTVKNVERYEG